MDGRPLWRSTIARLAVAAVVGPLGFAWATAVGGSGPAVAVDTGFARAHARSDAAASLYTLEPVARFGGMAWSLSLVGDTLHVGSYADGGARMVTWDVANPASPRRLGTSAALTGIPTLLRAQGDRLYAVQRAGRGVDPWRVVPWDIGDEAGIRLFSTAVPAHPWDLGLFAASDARDHYVSDLIPSGDE